MSQITEFLRSERENHWKAQCLFCSRDGLSDLDFRLYWGIPAWFYYKWSRTRLKIKTVKFRRYRALNS
jgi:hypothetical protein